MLSSIFKYEEESRKKALKRRNLKNMETRQRTLHDMHDFKRILSPFARGHGVFVVFKMLCSRKNNFIEKYIRLVLEILT